MKNALYAAVLALGLCAASLIASTAIAVAAAPELAITAPASGYVASSMPTFKGTTTDNEDSVTVTVHAGTEVGGAEVEKLTPLAGPAGGTWTASESGFLGDGSYTAVVEQTHEGEHGESQPVTFTVDTKSPIVSMSSVAEFTNEATPTLLGNGGTAVGDVQSVTVQIYSGGVATGTPIAEQLVSAAGGPWSYTAPKLADGTYTAQAIQFDEAGNEGTSSPQTFTVDTLGPSVSANAAAPYTASQKPTLTGHAGTAPGDLASVSIAIYQGTAAEGTKASAGNAAVSGGGWSYSPAEKLEPGTYTLQATQSDKAGNVSSSNIVTFTVDTTKPAVTIKALPTFTNDKTPAIEGSGGVAAGDRPTVVVRIYRGSNSSGTLVGTSAPLTIAGGLWSFTAPTLTPDGAYTAVVTQSDEAGNESSASSTFIVDSKPPSVTLTSPTNNQKFSKSQPTFSGAAGTSSGDAASVTVQISEVKSGEEVPVQTVGGIAVSGGGWTTGTSGPHLSNGEYTATVEQADAAGNLGKTKPVTFFVESRSPVVTLSTLGVALRGSEAFVGPKPRFTGFAQTATQDSKTIGLKVFHGTSASGPAVAEESGERVGSQWTIGPIPALADGVYTVQARQEAKGEEPGFSETSTFTVDGDAPHPAILAPVNGASLSSTTVSLSGVAGTAPGDDGAVTVEVFPGALASGTASETVTVPTAGGGWSAPLGTLPAGTYTALALQSDDVGNSGAGAPVSFTLSEPAPPVASFTWFPAAPHVGEPVSLVSTSTDPTSAIVGYGWSLAGTGLFAPGAQTIATSFTTPGKHVVQLRVSDQSGASSSVSETIPVTSVPIALMQPFPVVRIAGSEAASGVKIKLLTVQAPIGAKVSIGCKGKGCPTKLASALAAASKGKHPPGSAVITFRRFERLLPPGVTLEIKVSKAGEIGKYTRFVSRKHKLPTRADSCLSPVGKPMVCPST